MSRRVWIFTLEEIKLMKRALRGKLKPEDMRLAKAMAPSFKRSPVCMSDDCRFIVDHPGQYCEACNPRNN